ncbi:MAG TPA: DNA mismatch repair endonuclease MutL [Candidatus Acidoferrales bacterium]|nr:DNA mismatch repair endonuclease MutL [Candidatus Acidoferrales bacterium]
MNKIHQLPHDVVAKIAAGEVIERPVFAVKELVDNALDAGADAIDIHIEESGLKRIAVIDNGEGMSAADLQESFKSHTTSKLSQVDELSHIRTLGFRGEALSSIASVGRVTINSREKSTSSGTSIFLKNGKPEKISPIGMPAGTSVTIDYLFHDLPARKKFLKSPRTEFRHIIDLITSYALSYPQVHFVLTHNHKSILDLPKTDDTLQRIEKLLGKDIVSTLIPVFFQDSYITVSGFLAKPTVTTQTPSKQFLFINNRLISDKGISLSVKSAYGTLVAHNVYPICLLFFTLPYEMIDVNVHPRKEYVRFSDQTLFFDAITRAVKQTLTRYDLTPDMSSPSLFLHDSTGSTQSYAGRLLKEKKLPWTLSTALATDHVEILQMHQLYLLAVTDNGFLLIDQHAAHERILYEQLLREFVQEKKKHVVFHFSKPSVFDLSLSETELLLEHIAVLQDLGWEIEQFKDNSFVLRSLPVLFQDRDYVSLLKEILEDLKTDHKPQEFDTLTKRMIAYLACRSAIKAGDTVTKKQAKELVEQLEKTPNNASCPHGRPTRVAVDVDQINRLFRR